MLLKWGMAGVMDPESAAYFSNEDRLSGYDPVVCPKHLT